MKLIASMLIAFFLASLSGVAEQGSHLFILSGQSNMKRLKPETSFIPAVEAAFGKENVIVVKRASGGKPIRDWYKEWESEQGKKPQKAGHRYDALMEEVRGKTAGKKLASVSFFWMQGERDAAERHGKVYAASLRGLMDQLTNDLGREDINFVIGRLSDFDMNNQRYKHWTIVREALVAVAESTPRAVWVNTDDLNDKPRHDGTKRDDLHYTREGYDIFGKRLADAAIKLIQKHSE